MASFTASTARISPVSCNLKLTQVPQSKKIFGSRSSIAVFPIKRRSFPALNSRRSHISCAAKTGTVEKVCEIVRKQLALPDDSVVSGESKFTALGADSLDTVEIVMGLEEEFGISVEEESAQSIATVQDAADMIETLIQKTKAA